jgi:microcystin degradation protein MlrC
MMHNMQISMGPAALLDVDGVEVVVGSRRVQTLDTSMFTKVRKTPSWPRSWANFSLL